MRNKVQKLIEIYVDDLNYTDSKILINELLELINKTQGNSSIIIKNLITGCYIKRRVPDCHPCDVNLPYQATIWHSNIGKESAEEYITDIYSRNINNDNYQICNIEFKVTPCYRIIL